MTFNKNTIMGQVLSQVHENIDNEEYFDQIDVLLDEIHDQEYFNIGVTAWQTYGLVITDNECEKNNLKPDWVYVFTSDVQEYSWLVRRLVDIYKPSKTDSYRFFTTIGYLLNVYSRKYKNIEDIFRIVTMTSTIFLHHDHLGFDKFKVKLIDLPPFEDDF